MTVDAFARAEALHDELAHARREASLALAYAEVARRELRAEERLLDEAVAVMLPTVERVVVARRRVAEIASWAGAFAEIAAERADAVEAARIAYGEPLDARRCA